MTVCSVRASLRSSSGAIVTGEREREEREREREGERRERGGGKFYQ